MCKGAERVAAECETLHNTFICLRGETEVGENGGKCNVFSISVITHRILEIHWLSFDTRNIYMCNN